MLLLPKTRLTGALRSDASLGSVLCSALALSVQVDDAFCTLSGVRGIHHPCHVQE